MNKRRWIFASVVLAVLALSVAAWIGYRPLVERLGREAIAQLQTEMGAKLGATVEVKDVGIRWDWGFPILVLGPTSIIENETKKESVHWESSELVLDLVATIRAKHAKLSGVRIHGLKLALKESKPGTWGVVGIAPPSSTEKFDWEKWARDTAGQDANQIWGFELEGAELTAIPFKGEKGELKIGQARIAVEPKATEVVFQSELKVKHLRFPALWDNSYEDLAWVIQGRVDEKAWMVEEAQGNLGPIEAKLTGNYERREGGWALALDFQKGLTTQDMFEHFPKDVLSKNAESYLREALLAGRFEHLKVNLEQKKKFRFKLSSDFAQTRMHYLKDWPELEESSGHVVLDEKHLKVDLAQGFVRESSVQGRVSAEDWMSEQGSWNFGLQVDGEPADVESFMKEGPFHEKTGVFTQWLHAETPVPMKIEANVEGKSTRGRIEIGASDWKLEKYPEFSPKQSQALVEFDPKSFVISGIKGVVDQESFEAEAKYVQGSWAWSAKSQLKSERVAGFLSGLAVDALIVGKFPIVAKGTLKEGFTIEVDTTFKGLEISLPPPLNKERTTAQSFSLKVSGDKAQEGYRWAEMEGKWNDETAVQSLRWKAKRSDRSAKFELQGKIGELVVEQWQAAWREWGKRRAPAVATEEGLNWDTKGRLEIAQALWRDIAFASPSLQWSVGLQDGRVEWSAPELALTATWKKPMRENELNLHASRMKFPKMPGKSTWAEEEGIASEPWNLEEWPSTNLNFSSILVGERNYGNLRGRIIQTGEAIEISSMELQGGEIRAKVLEGKSDYKRSKLSKLELEIQASDTLLPMSFKKLESAQLQRTKLRFKGAWPGGPDAFGFGALSGSLTGSVGFGILRGVNSTGARLVNALSFSQGDMRQKILRFRRAYIDFHFDGGTITTEQTKALFGSVFARLKGKIIVPEERLSLQIQRVPGVEDVPDPEFEPFYPDPEHLLSSSSRIEGKWDDPSIGL